MGLETGTYITDLVMTNPAPSDDESEGDDHLRLIKTTLRNSLAGFPGVILATGAETQGDTVNDYTVTVSPAPAAYTASSRVIFKATHANTGACTLQVNALGKKGMVGVDGFALPAGAIPAGTVCEAFYDGTNFYLCSASGGLRVPTPPSGDNSTRIATTAFATQLAFQAAVPDQSGHSNSYLFTDGTNSAWRKGGWPTTPDILTAGSNQFLTAAAAPIQIVSFTGEYFSVWLPDATTMAGRDGLFEIRNGGNYAFSIRNFAGTLFVVLPPGERCLCVCSSSTSAAGQWEFFPTLNLGVRVTASSVLAAESCTGLEAAPLATDKCLIAWKGATQIKVAVVTRLNDTISIGTPLAIATSTTIYSPMLLSLSATSAVLAWDDSTNTDLRAVALSISGTTVTAGAAVSLSATRPGQQGGRPSGVALDSSRAVFTWIAASGNQLASCVTASGTTLTAGTAVAVSGTAGVYELTGIASLGGGNLVIGHAASFTNTSYLLFSSSGNTLTLGASSPGFPLAGPLFSIATNLFGAILSPTYGASYPQATQIAWQEIATSGAASFGTIGSPMGTPIPAPPRESGVEFLRPAGPMLLLSNFPGLVLFRVNQTSGQAQIVQAASYRLSPSVSLSTGTAGSLANDFAAVNGPTGVFFYIAASGGNLRGAVMEVMS